MPKAVSMYPTPVGYYKVPGGLEFHLHKKACWFHRLMIRLLLGWKWQDYSERDIV